MALYATLGEIEFNLLTYFDGFEIKFAANYAEHALIGRKPRLQFVGDALDEIKLDCRFDVAFCDPEAELLKLKDALSSHEAMALTFGNGDYKGRFVVTELPATARQTDRAGTLQSVEASITLREFVGDGRASAAPAVLVTGTLPPLPTELSIPPVPPSLAAIHSSVADLPSGAPLPRLDGLALGVAQTKAALSGTASVMSRLDQLRQVVSNPAALLGAAGALADVQKLAGRVQSASGAAAASMGVFAKLSGLPLAAHASAVVGQLGDINRSLNTVKTMELNSALGGQLGTLSRQLNSATTLTQSPLAQLATHVICRD